MSAECKYSVLYSQVDIADNHGRAQKDGDGTGQTWVDGS